MGGGVVTVGCRIRWRFDGETAERCGVARQASRPPVSMGTVVNREGPDPTSFSFSLFYPIFVWCRSVISPNQTCMNLWSLCLNFEWCMDWDPPTGKEEAPVEGGRLSSLEANSSTNYRTTSNASKGVYSYHRW
jgi:hypothetical protein